MRMTLHKLMLTLAVSTAILSQNVWAEDECNVPQVSNFDHAGCLLEGLAHIEHKGKWGYIDKTGKIVIPLQFDGADEFDKGQAFVDQDGESFYINKQGERVDSD